MKAKLPESYTIQMASLDEVPRIHQLEEKKSLHYHDVPGFSLERLQNSYQEPGFEMEKSILLVEDQNKNLAALVEVWDVDNPPVHPYVWLAVDPDHERKGLEAYLLEWAEERAGQVFSRLEPDLRVSLRAHVEQSVKNATHALEEAGYQQIRHSFRMRIDMQEPPPAPVWPDGIKLTPYDPEKDAYSIFEVDEEVFSDHFGYVEVEDPEEEFKKFMHHMTGDDSYDPTMWYIARNGDEIVGICICRRYGHEDKVAGHIGILGVRRPWRRQGLGLAMLQHSFGEFYRRGQTTVDLGVDAESLTGATDLYKKAGMYVLRQFNLYDKELRSGKEVSVTSLEASEA